MSSSFCRVAATIVAGMLAALASALPAAAAVDGPLARVTVALRGGQANDASFTPAVSAEGRWVVFASEASNLVPGDFNYERDVFLRDTVSGRTSRISVSSTGRQGNAASFNPSISDDGRWIVFDSFAANLVPGDLNRLGDVFLHDRLEGATTRISRGLGGRESNGQSGFAVISGDGNLVAFESTASNLLAGGTGRATQIWAWDRRRGTTELVTRTLLGDYAGGGSGNIALSRDGGIVAFSSTASNLVPHDVNLTEDVFVRDRATGFTRRVSVNSLGGESNAASTEPSISADGRFVAFESRASTLLGFDATGQDAPKLLVNPQGILDVGDTNFAADVFVHDTATGHTERVSVTDGGQQVRLDSYGASISGDGRLVAFVSLAEDLVPGDTNGMREVFIRDRSAATTSRVGTGRRGAQGDQMSISPALSRDGSTVVFVSESTNLVPGDRNAEGDVFLRR